MLVSSILFPPGQGGSRPQPAPEPKPEPKAEPGPRLEPALSPVAGPQPAPAPSSGVAPASGAAPGAAAKAALAADLRPALATADEEALARAQAIAALAELRRASVVEAVSRVARGLAAPTSQARLLEAPEAGGPGAAVAGAPAGDRPAPGQGPAPSAPRLDLRA